MFFFFFFFYSLFGRWRWFGFNGREVKMRERGERWERIDMVLGYIILLDRYIISMNRIEK